MARQQFPKLLLVLWACAGVTVAMEGEDWEATTVIVVRHAEKETGSTDPGLTPEGEGRSRRLRDLAIDAGVTGVYSSQYLRTQATVRPLAEALDLEVTIVDAREPGLLAEKIVSGHAGGVVVVAGHSNTVPAIVAALGAPQPAEIPEADYGNLFVVTVTGLGKAEVLRLKF